MNITRPSIGLVIVIAAWWPSRERRTITWAPLVRASIGAAAGSSIRRSRSVQGPVAFTTMVARMVAVSPVRRSSTCAPLTWPSSRARSRTAVRVATRAPWLHRRTGNGQRQAGVVALCVVVARGTGESAGPERRFLPEQGALAEDARPPHIAEQGEELVEPDAGRELPERDPVAPMDRKDEGERPHQVRREAQQDAPLAAGLEDEVEGSLLQVAEAAVHQPAGM